jgi:hypothetical protein
MGHALQEFAGSRVSATPAIDVLLLSRAHQRRATVKPVDCTKDGNAFGHHQGEHGPSESDAAHFWDKVYFHCAVNFGWFREKCPGVQGG